MKAIISTLVLLGFVGVATYAQDATPDAEGTRASSGADRDPAKAHKKKSKKKKHSKKHKTTQN